ncbi:MAG TPA: glycosyltransferase family 1 protein [Acidimicrobiales bacterium]|nr:glycosyltransferase family 1 protein [Acidimicrobiales bacterium]
MSLVGVNLCWMVTGEVGGSESYLTRVLTGVAEGAPAFDYRLFVLPGFAAAHPELAAAFPVDVAPVTGRQRSLRVAAESTWLANRARRAGVDVMHHGGGTVPPGPRRRTVLTIHDLQYLTYPEFFSSTKRRYLDAVMPRSARRSDVVVTPSAFVKDTVVERLGVPSERIRVVPIPAELHPPEPAPSDEVRARYGLGERPFFLYPAITYPHKNHIVLVEAMSAVVDRHPEAALVLTAGSAGAESALEAEIFRRNLAGHVRRTGRVAAADLERLYLDATALVMPSRYEGFGAPVVEAMQRGCPVIAANVTALPEIVGDAGILIDPGDVGGWADAMCRLLDDGAVGDDLAARGNARVSAFAADRAAAALEDAYRQALA